MPYANEGMFYVFSDCKILVKAVQEKQMEDIPSWQAAETVKQCWMSYEILKNKVKIHAITRAAIKTPHNLANWVRRTGTEGTGTPIQCQISHLEIEHKLNNSFFVLEGA